MGDCEGVGWAVYYLVPMMSCLSLRNTSVFPLVKNNLNCLTRIITLQYALYFVLKTLIEHTQSNTSQFCCIQSDCNVIGFTIPDKSQNIGYYSQ